MKKRISRSVFFVSLAVNICCATLSLAVLYNRFKADVGSAGAGESTSDFLLAVLVSAVISFVAALFTAHVVSKRTLKELNDINLDDPNDSNFGSELSLMFYKIRSQNSQIQSQLRELERSQQEFKMITENMSEGLIIIDLKHSILSFNRSAKQIFGVENIKKHENVFTINQSERFKAAVNAALSGRHGELTMKMHDRIYSVFANPVVNGEKIVGAVIVVLDVTEREKGEQLRREFTANVSHELKTPLTSISGFAEIIMNGIARPEDVRHFAENIYNESARLITLVGDIIKISQLDEGLVGAEKTDVDLLEIARKTANSLQSVASKNDITISVDGETSCVKGVYDIIDEMVYNLCDNAVKYNRPGGSVDITVENKTITVADTGIGIPLSSQPRVFERFYRVDKSHSKEIGGTGLGLSIVKHAALYHGAKIDLESVENVGTKIKISF